MAPAAALLKPSEQRQLIGMRGVRHPPVGASIDAFANTWIARPQVLQCFGPAAGKSRLFPNLVQAARVAGVTAHEFFRPDFQPARNPNLDGVILGQGAARDGGRWGIEKDRGHETLHSDLVDGLYRQT